MKLAVIGTGNMAQAIIGGILKKGVFSPEEIIASNPHADTLARFSASSEASTTQDNAQAASMAEVIVLAVKPQYYEEVIRQIAPCCEGKLVISLAPGKTIAYLQQLFAKYTAGEFVKRGHEADEANIRSGVRIVRTMPNTPAVIGEGVTAYCTAEAVGEQDVRAVEEILGSLGAVYAVPETLMEAVVCVAGSAPAYIFMLLEAMGDGAVALGMPRKLAYEMAAQTVAGSARLLLASQKHPGELKDMVCSPGGTTIEAVRTLEKSGFRSALIEAMESCAQKSREL